MRKHIMKMSKQLSARERNRSLLEQYFFPSIHRVWLVYCLNYD